MRLPGAMGGSELASWLARVHHDLVKRLLWPARDRRDAGGPVVPGELIVALVDNEGHACDARELWRRLEADAPKLCAEADKEAFARAVEHAVDAAARDDLEGVLALGAAYQHLARNVKPPT